jgi:hypothetical protein
MSKYLGSLVVVLTGIACGGTTDTGDQSGGGAPSGGQTHGGSASGGSVATAGKASAGDTNVGGNGIGGSSNVGGSVATGGSIGIAGSISVGGSINVGGTGGAGTFDPRCPAQRPTGACVASDTGLSCEYDAFTNCLCYMRPPGNFALCQKVDPTCPAAGGAPAAPPPSPGAGGISAKIALPPQQVCSCIAGMWSCGFGI